MKRSIIKILKNSFLQHVLFWGLSFYVLLTIFAYSKDYSAVDFIYTWLFHISLWASVYLTLRLWIPSFLEKKKLPEYVISLSATAFFGVLLNIFTFNYLADIIFPGYYFIESYGFVDILKFVAIYLAATSLLKFSKSWFSKIEIEQKINRIAREKSLAEMSALKAQVSPHFLFNSLNNLYSLALDKDEKTPAIVLLISEMMRYLLYETNAEQVILEKEIGHLKNYIELQQLRIGNQAEIVCNIEGELDKIKIAPLLFLPLVENAFKHGGRNKNGDYFAKMNLIVKNDSVDFSISNSIGTKDGLLIGNRGGFGLKNLKQRLGLSYPDKHDLLIDRNEEVHFLTLNLRIK